MSNAFLYGKGNEEISPPNLFGTNVGTNVWFEHLFNSTFYLYKDTWTKIAKLRSSEYKKAIIYCHTRLNTEQSYAQIGEMDKEIIAATRGGYNVLSLKISKDEDGYISAYAKLCDDSLWSSLSFLFGGSATNRFEDFAILPIS